jgi:hypothetical protein
MNQQIQQLITSVQIKQSFLKLYKMTQTEDYLIKANSWNSRIKGLKDEIKILRTYGSLEKYLKHVLGE